MVLGCREMMADVDIRVRTIEELLQVDRSGLPVRCSIFLFQEIIAADHIVDFVEAQTGHDFPQVPGDEMHEIDDIFWLALEILPQFFILCADTVRAGVEMTYAEHVAADGHEGSRAESEQFGTEQGGDGYVAAREQFAVHFDAHPVAELIEQQCLLYFRKADFPGKTGMAQTGPR